MELNDLKLSIKRVDKWKECRAEREKDLSNSNPLNAYKETKIRTASQGKLIIMLYDEAIKQIDLAMHEIESETKKFDKVNDSISKAQNIITELMVSLDFNKGEEIAKSLFSLYMYFNQQLLEANINKTVKPLKPVRKMLAELRGTWIEVIRKVGANNEGVSGGVNIAG